MTKKEFVKLCPTLAVSKKWMLEKDCEGEYGFNYHRKDYKTEKGFVNYLKRAEEKEREALTAAAPDYLYVEINWHKNRTWGNCPTAECWHNGEKYTAHATGCGYDKGSTVLANICNKILRSALWAKRRQIKKAPYGINKDSFTFGWGIGLNQYAYHIFPFLGYKVEKHSGKTWDSITISK